MNLPRKTQLTSSNNQGLLIRPILRSQRSSKHALLALTCALMDGGTFTSATTLDLGLGFMTAVETSAATTNRRLHALLAATKGH